jgi:cell division protein FtsI (penicillin-binding protein 3)
MRLGALNGRLRYGFAAVCTLLLVVGGRLVQLQGVDGAKYADAAAAQRIYTTTLQSLRGEIVDRNGTVLAYTSDAQDITADPKQVPAAQREAYAQKLAPLTGASEASIEAALAKPSEYALLATALAPDVAQRIEALDLPGIYTQATTQREYPGHRVAANIIGTMYANGSGAAGIEEVYNRALAGKNGSITYTVDNTGNVNPNSRTVTHPARNGGTVKLTIDQSLQYTVQADLGAAVQKYGAKDAEAVVLDAHTGQVLAMGASGTFDATNPNTISSTAPLNPDIESAFEPGSVQKSITFAAALDKGLIKPNTMLSVPDQINMDGVTVGDAWWHPTEPFTATGVLAKSSNVGTLKIAQMIGPKTWDAYEKAFGVGTATGIELPGESSGYLPPMDQWSGSSFANLPFGQGESMTVLQLASIYQTIANGGVRIPPRIVASVTSSDGSVDVTKQPAGIRVIKPSTAQTLITMLKSVVLPGGTGVNAAINGYEVAGKTGTAQQPDPALGGRYSLYKNWDTFAGMVPADNPQFVVAIMVDDPPHELEGGDVSAPLFHSIASYELQHAHIQPTGAVAKHVPLEDCNNAAVREDSPSTVC